MSSELEIISNFDTELVAIVQGFNLLTPLNWSKEIMHQCLDTIDRKEYKFPQVVYPKIDYTSHINALKIFLQKISNLDHPAAIFLKETAESYLDGYYILSGTGSREVNKFSRKLYGCPEDSISDYGRRNIDIAEYFLRVAEEYKFTLKQEELIYDTMEFKSRLQQIIKKHIIYDNIVIIIDSNLAARASAGPNYVKLRKGARFSESDLNQLFHHEVMIHTLTYLNGRRQKLLKNLGYTSPRTTATQEGLAVFAEYINISIELVRLKRIALRIIAINMAEQGADLLELFRFFQEHGQDNEESYYSAMRIFRGGTPKGGIIFYKDNVYLRGLIEISSFLTHAMHQGTLHNIALLFAGKMTTEDVVRFQPLLAENYISKPTYMPAWAVNSGELAAHLAFNDLTELFRNKEIKVNNI